MKKASRELIFINTSPPEGGVERLKSLNGIKGIEDHREEIYMGGLLKRCSKWPFKYDHLTLADWAAWCDSHAKSCVKQFIELDTDNLPVEASINNDDNENDDEISEVLTKVKSRTKKRNKPRVISSCWFSKE